VLGRPRNLLVKVNEIENLAVRADVSEMADLDQIDLPWPVQYSSGQNGYIEIDGYGLLYSIQKVDAGHTILHIYDRHWVNARTYCPRALRFTDDCESPYVEPERNFSKEYLFLRRFDPQEFARMESSIQFEYPDYTSPKLWRD
jgi:hypothetical protein